MISCKRKHIPIQVWTDYLSQITSKLNQLREQFNTLDANTLEKTWHCGGANSMPAL